LVDVKVTKCLRVGAEARDLRMQVCMRLSLPKPVKNKKLNRILGQIDEQCETYIPENVEFEP